MPFISVVKSTFLLWVLWTSACGNPSRQKKVATEPSLEKTTPDPIPEIIVAANRTSEYISLLQAKKVGVVANQTSVIFKNISAKEEPRDHTHLVDSLLSLGIDIQKVFAPEHGFRGTVDAGEKVTDGVDTKTGLPIVSLYGKNRKPSAGQLADVDVVLFDIQDVGVRFYTYIATLQLVMEACAEEGIPVIVLDRPNPNGHYVDGPIMEKAHTGFLGMTEIPLVYGMTIGEYATLINEEGWLEEGNKADLTIITLENWNHSSEYSLPIRPSPNLPNDVSITLYPSLGLFEGTNINAGRGTEFQFQRYGAPFLDPKAYDFQYTPIPNFGAKNPKHKDVTCYGKNLADSPKMHKVSLQWLIDAYQNAPDPSKVFNKSGFTKHAGTEKLQEQIEAGLSEMVIKASWKNDLEEFKLLRKNYLLYD